MVIAVRTEEADGGLVVIKEARSDGDVARLTREASFLGRSRHPGVVELVEVGERSLTLRHAGTALARLGPFPTDQVAGIVCAVADVVQALHRLGVVHGDLDAGHVLLDDRGRPRLCGFGLAQDRTPEGAADDVAALGRLLASLLRPGADLAWARPPSGLRRGAAQRQARRELEAIAAQATRDQREQRPTARQLAKAVHAAVPGCSLPVPGATDEGDRPAFAEIPSDIDPTSDLSWTEDDLSWLAAEDERLGPDLDDIGAGPYAGLGTLGELPQDDEPDDWAELAANPDPVTGPLPVLDPDHVPEPIERATIPAGTMPTADEPTGPSIALPGRDPDALPERRRLPIAWVAGLVVVLVLGIVGGVAGARALLPVDDDDLGTTGAGEAGEPDTEPAGGEPVPPTWPEGCAVPDPAGPDVDGDGCPDEVVLDGRTARIGSVTVDLGDEGDLVALGDWDCDGTATPALLRPSTGEVFVFPEWSLREPIEVVAVTVVDGGTDISTGPGSCPSPVVTTPDGERVVEVPGS
jgi:tRNA A-37 threonylcarbamoyl transferase component Bud32